MVGIKGKSGRKPNETGWQARAQTLYIPSYVSGTKKGKKEYLTISWFRLFKKIYGSRATSLSPYNWQEKIRIMIKQEVERYTNQNGWFCNCPGDRFKRWHFRHDPQCMKCDYEPSLIERHRTQAQVTANTPLPGRASVAKVALSICPTHGKPLGPVLEKVSGVMSKVMRCEDCVKL